MRTDFMSRYGWIPILAVTLGLSNWSLAVVARKWGVTFPLNYLASIPFDLIALRAGSIALFYARTHGESGLSARVFTVCLVGMSAYLNAQHAIINHGPYAARIFYASFPVAAYVLFELESRRERRTALRRAGMVAEPLTALGRWKWILFPARSFQAIRRIERYRLDQITRLAVGEVDDTPQTTVSAGESGRIRAWARLEGYHVSDRGRIPASITEAYYLATGQLSGGLDNGDYPVYDPSVNGNGNR